MSSLIGMKCQQLTLGGLCFFEKLAVVTSSPHVLKWQQSATAHRIFSVPHTPRCTSCCSQASSPHSFFGACLSPEGICAGHTGPRCAFCCFNYITTHANCSLCVGLLFAPRCTFLEGRGCGLYFFLVCAGDSTVLCSNKHVLNECFYNS